MTLINTKGMAFIGPGSEWFWAALQFTALAITFVAIYRQLRIARSQRAVEQVTLYTQQFENERMARHQLAILVALRDGVEIPRAAGVTVGSYFETLGSLTRSKQLDIKLLWNLFNVPTLLWWAALGPFVQSQWTEHGHKVFEEYEWLVGVFTRMDRRAGQTVAYDVATWLAAGAIKSFQDNIQVEQALRSVIIASPDGFDAAPVAAAPARTPSSGKRRETAHREPHSR